MAEFHYKSFISYSHQDEAWAKWLHRALEAYRIPRRLVGTEGKFGEIPARINPVFRDRDDLSAARDLSKKIVQALGNSESLIIICSPSSAQSHWVNEEIRQFRSMSQGDRIYCLIVDGDPQLEPRGDCCFPPALFEEKQQTNFEPLAADIRKWADGKRLAKLKLVAGLLGIRLDELRQRDLNRRRKIMALAVVGVLAALTLTIITVVSEISRQHEREKAEQMATVFISLGETLQSDTDLETLALLSAEASRYFQDIDAENLSLETGIKVALTLRQVGRIGQLQGRSIEALQSFERSRDVLSGIKTQYPDNPELIFELGNAEFYIGNFYLKQGEYSKAQIPFQNNHELTGILLNIDPQNPAWIMERSYTHNNLAAVQLKSSEGVNEETLNHLKEAIRLIEKTMSLEPDNTTYASHYSNTLAWAADAQYQACNLQNALSMRNKVKQLAEASAQSDPGDNDLKRRFAYAISGLAEIQTYTGNLTAAEENTNLAMTMLEQLSVADPSNVLYQQESVRQKMRFARLIAGSDRLNEARALMEALGLEIIANSKSVEESEESVQSQIEFLSLFANIEFLTHDPDAANSHLQHALQLQMDGAEPNSLAPSDRASLIEMRFQWWEINGDIGLDAFPVLNSPNETANGTSGSCEDAFNSARWFVLEGDMESAGQMTAYLHDRGYADPAFMGFCHKYGLCPE